MVNYQQGDFSGLAEKYSLYRPGYSESVLSALLSLVGKPVAEIDFADIGAGTGIWSRMVAARGIGSAVSVEPNDDMRSFGIRDSGKCEIDWTAGNGEATGLETSSKDLLTMASSFHWVEFDKGVKEFSRVLRPGGIFAALWNPREIEVNPLLVEIEAKLDELRPTMSRVSSGRSGITATLTRELQDSAYFEDVVYLEGRHVSRQTPEQYLGVWWSVNDVRAQLGESNFKAFMSAVEEKIEGLEYIETTYLTRAWAARNK